jgi:hypothetical protein
MPILLTCHAESRTQVDASAGSVTLGGGRLGLLLCVAFARSALMMCIAQMDAGAPETRRKGWRCDFRQQARQARTEWDEAEREYGK